MSFDALHSAMDSYVGQEILPCVSSAIIVDGKIADSYCTGWADRENKIPITQDHIFRVYSNTKLTTSCAALLLHEEGHFELDDPIEKFIPRLGKMSVLRPGASSIDDVEPAARPITIRHLLTHTSGFGYDIVDPESLIVQHYETSGVRRPHGIPSEPIDIDVLADLPLIFHPGTQWHYSFSTDVIGRMIEIISGDTLGDFLKKRIFDPLGMNDTEFWVPEEKRDRLVQIYDWADFDEPMKPGLKPVVYGHVYRNPTPRQSGGGGLVSTLPDTVRLLNALVSTEGGLLKPQSMAFVTTNLLPEGLWLQWPTVGVITGKGHGAAGGISVETLPHEDPRMAGEIWWGGVAGTRWWISPKYNLAGAFMTQRLMTSAHPYSGQLKNLAYKAVLG